MVQWPCNPKDINTMQFNWKFFSDHLFWSVNEFSFVDNNIIIWYSWGFLRTTVALSTQCALVETGKPEWCFSFSHPKLCIVSNANVGWGRRSIYLAGLTSSVTNVAQSLKCSNLMASEMFRQHLLLHLKWAEFFQWKSDEEEFTWHNNRRLIHRFWVRGSDWDCTLKLSNLLKRAKFIWIIPLLLGPTLNTNLLSKQKDINIDNRITPSSLSQKSHFPAVLLYYLSSS